MFNFIIQKFKRTCWLDCEHIHNLESKIYSLQDQCKVLVKKAEYLNVLKYFNKQNENIFLITELNSKLIIVTQNIVYDTNYTVKKWEIKAYCGTSGNPPCCLLQTIYSHPRYDKEYKFINAVIIDDFIGSYINQGYGSLVMNAFLDYMRSLSIHKIVCHLSFVDIGHRDRQIHFYKKFGFTIMQDKVSLDL